MRATALLLLAAALMAEEPWRIGSEGVTYHATAAEELTRPIRFERTGSSGLDATFIARCLRGVQQDDWRKSQTVAGTRHDTRIEQPTNAFGTEADRRRFGIAGGPNDWDNFSVQWDGMILVPAGGVDLATASDDGSRMWLDSNHDGIVQADEWGSNGWGNGQGTTLRLVHAGVAAGTSLIRVQTEEGGGGDSCTLHWRPAGSTAAWSVVPDAAFARTPVLSLDGPVTFRSPVSGDGELRLGDGAILATTPPVSTLAIVGQVRLAADVVAPSLHLVLPRDATLDLAGHRLDCATVEGAGTFQLAGGTLVLRSAGAVAVRGRGRLEVRCELTLAGIDPGIDVQLVGQAALRSAERCLVRRPLAAPLATVFELGEMPADAGRLAINLEGPLAGCGLVVWRADRHGRWFQRLAAPGLSDGRRQLEVDMSATADFRPVGHDAPWNDLTASESRRAGLIVYADHAPAGNAGSVLADVRWLPARERRTPPVLLVQQLPRTQVATGERIELAVRPEPFPALPMDPACFDLELEVTAPDGTVQRYAGFPDQPFRRLDRGDREVLTADGPARFGVRFRARQAGSHRLRLLATWAGGGTAVVELPAVTATGQPWDDIVRPDAGDPRFLSSQGRFVWPIGQNLNSTYDVRSQGCLATKLTPNRGSFTREAFLARLIAAGGTGAETWLSPWNLGVEWTDAWVGYHGAGHPNLGNGWALDRYLDLAERNGVRVILSIFNHGQGRDGSGAEDDWPHHPWSVAHGGWLAAPRDLFDDARALQAQSNLFRYLAARWGDSPAVLAWKLWAEVNLTHAPNELKVAWHAKASALFARHDPWRHPVTTHWCADYTAADPEISAQPGMGMLTIDAYHGEETNLADLLGMSTRDARRSAGGLAMYGKPVLVSEFGGSPGACAPARLAAELAISGWAALVHGHAGAPMMWWFEWIDQGSRYGSFGALRRYTAGEDLRNPAGRAVVVEATCADGPLWGRAWLRSGRILGYLLDAAWAVRGGDGTMHQDGVVDLAEARAGSLRLEWWDADLGVILSTTDLDHPGGRLRLAVPPFQRHLAFKLWRREAEQAGGPAAQVTPAAANR